MGTGGSRNGSDTDVEGEERLVEVESKTNISRMVRTHEIDGVPSLFHALDVYMHFQMHIYASVNFWCVL